MVLFLSGRLLCRGFRLMLLSLLLLLSLPDCGNLLAQGNYPVYVQPNLQAPYSLRLSDYGQAGGRKLVVNLHVNDLTITNLPVCLHIRMETLDGRGVETAPNTAITPFYLGGGQTSMFSGEDLEPYFAIDNLIFKGYSKEQYRRTGQLPEGFYRVTVEVRHFPSGKLISNRGTAMGWFALGKPPVLLSPSDNTQQGQTLNNPLLFSWQPNNVAVPGVTQQYTFELWELRVDGINQNVVAQSMPPLLSRQLMQKQLVLYPSELNMIPGMRYAWRVTASDINGGVAFENQGRSELRSFQFLCHCNQATGLKVVANGQNALFSWDADSKHTGYIVEAENLTTGYHNTFQLYDNSYTLRGLDYGNTCRLRVAAICNQAGQYPADFTDWVDIHIAAPVPVEERCPECRCEADKSSEPALTNTDWRTDLQAGDVVQTPSGRSRFRIVSAQPTAPGVYKGQFAFLWDYYGLNVLCDYSNLRVNAENKIRMDYVFRSVFTEGGVLNTDKAASGIDDLLNAGATLTTSFSIQDSTHIGGTITDIYTNPNGEIVGQITDGNGNTTTQVITGSGATLITDAGGNQYVVTKDGTVMGLDEFKQTGGNDRLMDNYKAQKDAASRPVVGFAPSPGQRYGFDAYDATQADNPTDYPELKPGYRPAFKSVGSWQPDKVRPITNGKSYVYRSEAGIPAVSQADELVVRGLANGSETALYAYNPDDTTHTVVGKLNVLSFDETRRKLVLVSINGAQLPDPATLKAGLDAMYAPAVTVWDVQSGTLSLNLTFPQGSLTHGGSSLFGVYNSDQKMAIKALQEQLSPDKTTCYLFFADHVQGRENVQGYMPLGYNYGFIYDTRDTRTIAHELGHGAFGLKHLGLAAGATATSNLMDYNAGHELRMPQWKQINDPGFCFNLFQSEEEGELKLNDNEYLGFSPNGDVIDVNKLKHKINSFDPKNTNYVYAMSIDGKSNTYKWDSSTGGFKYEDETIEHPYLNNINRDIKVAIWVHQTDSCYGIYKYIPIDKGYVPTSFARIETERINNADYSKGWIIHDANTLDAECKQKAEAAIARLANKAIDCTPNYKITIPSSVALWVNSHPEVCLKNLGADERWNLIKILSTDLGGSIAKVEGEFDSDDALLRLLAFTSDELQKITLYQKLKTEKANGQLSYLDVIINTMDDEDLVLFSKWMMQCTIAQSLPNAEKTNKDKNIPVYLYKNTDDGAAYQGIKFTLTFERANGKIYITQKRLNLNGDWPATDYYQKRAFAPDELVKLHFYGDLRYGLETIYHSNSDIAIPALALWSIIEQKKERDLTLGIKAVAFILSLPAITEGGTSAAFAAVDALALGSDIAIEDTGWKNKISSEKGKKCLAGYEIFINLYFAGRAIEAVGVLDGLKASYKDWKSTATNVDEIVLVEGKIGKIVGEISNSTSEVTIAGKIIRVGDEFAGITIKQIRPGTNGKVFIIARQMNPITKVADELVLKFGADNVEIFAKGASGTTECRFLYQGKKYLNDDFEVLLKDLEIGNYDRYLNGPLEKQVVYEKVLATKLGKLNQAVIDEKIQQGYTILDLGNPNNVTNPSGFYDMEVQHTFK